MMKQQEQARMNEQANARRSFPQHQQFSGVGASLEDFIDELT